MMGMPISWIIISALIAGVGGYITYLKWRRSRAEARVAAVTQERDNAIVEQATIQTAQDAEHAYQQAHDDVIHSSREENQGDESRPASSMLDKLNSTAPLLLLCLVLVGCASSPPRVVVSNPAAKVIIPAPTPLEHYEFQERQGYYCLDQNNAAAWLSNHKKRTARIKGLESMLKALGAKDE